MSSIIHIGYHKTGTNWFQCQFYPSVNNKYYINRKKVRKAFLHDHALHFDPLIAKKMLGLSNIEFNDVILCEEELSGNIHNGGFRGSLTKDVANRIKNTFLDPQIIIFIRNQITSIASCYIQYIMEGGTWRPRQYFFPEYALRNSQYSLRYASHFSMDHFDYLALVQHYSYIFGHENVWVFPFESFIENPKQFIENFAYNLNLDVNIDMLDFSPMNKSIPSSFLPIKRFLNHFTWRNVPDKHYFFEIPGLHRVQNRLFKQLGKLSFFKKNQAVHMDASTRKWIVSRFSESNSILQEKWNLPLSYYGYPLPRY